MLSRTNTITNNNNISWMENQENTHNNNNVNVVVNNGHADANHHHEEIDSISTFKSMLDVVEDDDQSWFLANTAAAASAAAAAAAGNSHHPFSPSNLFAHPLDSSSCTPSPAPVFSSIDPNVQGYFLPPKPAFSSILNPIPGISNNPLEKSFDLGYDNGFLSNRGSGFFSGFGDLGCQGLGGPNLGSDPDFSAAHLLQVGNNGGVGSGSGFGFPGFEDGSGSNMLFNRSKVLKPLDNFASSGGQPTLFQKRALRRNLSGESGGNLGVLGEGSDEKRRKTSSWDDMDNLSFDGTSLNYDSDDFTRDVGESVKNDGGNSSNANSAVTGGIGDNVGDQKGKKKGLPAKNLMAERRRRKKLNDRLYMLRSVVPKISKMDRASILGDAIEYLKELLQKINDLHNELESTPPNSSLTPNTGGFYPLTPTPPTLPGRIKEELCPSPLPSPTGQPVRVEVRQREGRAVNIHMFCGRRPGLLLSTMRALDNLGLDVQQAVISCFNGFALDVFRAEQCKEEGQDVHPDQIKAVLLESAGFHGMV